MSPLTRLRLVVVGIDVSGKFGTETVQFLRLLARHRAESVLGRRSPAHAGGLSDGPVPDLHDVLADVRSGDVGANVASTSSRT